MPIEVKFKRLWSHDISVPAYQTEGAAGFDLRSADDYYPLGPGETRLFSTGFAIAIPNGYEGQIRSRSGMACKYSIMVINSPGTIDSDYRGEIKIGLVNLGKEEFIVEPGMRVAQMVISPVVRAAITEVTNLDVTVRNTSGFGSTGAS